MGSYGVAMSNHSMGTLKFIHNFAPLHSFFARSLNSLLKNFPMAFFGISSTKTTPPLNCLYGASRALTYSLTSSSEIFRGSAATTYARGRSVVGSSIAGTPTTAASLICGCVKRRFSISAGATWRPLYFRSSYTYHSVSHQVLNGGYC